jgi:hypothetical protein
MENNYVLHLKNALKTYIKITSISYIIMSEHHYLNLTYESPCQDFAKNIGFNPDSSLNISYTLGAMRELLRQNVQLLDCLLENPNLISGIEPIGTKNISIFFKDNTQLKEMIEKGIVRLATGGSGQLNESNELNELDESDNSADEPTEEIPEDMLNDMPTETHTDRLNRIQNLFGLDFADSDYSSDSDMISDTMREKYLCEKYYDLL